jgi:hypothetical protein
LVVTSAPAGYGQGMKWVKRGIMALAIVNFVASIWFAQYLITGWVIALYVLGSFALVMASIAFAE